MNTVTLSLEDYNELKAKADAYDSYMKECERFANNLREAEASFKKLDDIIEGKELVLSNKKNRKR